MIKYIDLGVSKKEFNNNILPLVKEIFSEGSYITDKKVQEFEENFSNYCGSKYAIAVNSGTDALIFALQSLGISKGDEVITVSNSFIATANAIKYVGATPVFVDINDDLLMDSSKIESAITKKTKAIMPVQLMGSVCDMKKIKRIAKKHNLFIIEDAAQSVGSKYKNSRTGTLGDIGCFSLHPLKNLSGITDGGIVTTNNKKVAQYIQQVRNHGLKTRDKQNIVGRVSRLNSLGASILNYRLAQVDKIIKKRRENALYYQNLLADIKDISIVKTPKNIFHSYHTFIILAKQRNKLQKYLQEKGIETKIHYPIAIHKQKPFKKCKGKLPHTEKLAKKILTLPLGNISKKEMHYVVKIIESFYKGEA